MTRSTLCLVCLVLISCFVGSLALLEWLFGENNEEESAVATPITKGAVPFEMGDDEKFMMEAHTGKELSQLDFCHHSVIVRLQGSCSDLTEEELGKLSVQLLNCQSHAENRPVYPCTKDMTIADCTQDMDATTWNAYQIVSNRARAICYATRQAQFRMKTEYTVNQLVHATLGQLNTMKQIEEDQSKITQATSETLEKMALGQQEILARQTSLRNTQRNVQSSLARNIKDLFREKALISSGNKQLAEMTDSIRKKLDTATAQLDAQEKAQRENHNEILDDLATIRDKAKEVWTRIDNSSSEMLTYHDQTTEQYKDTMENLQRVNDSVARVLTSIQVLQSSVENKLNWIAVYLGGTGDRVALMTTILLHFVYFLLAAVSAALLQTPMMSRIILLLIVPLNAFTEIRQGKSLGFPAMTAFIVMTVMANWIVGWTWYLYYSRKSAPRRLTSANREHRLSESKNICDCGSTMASPAPDVPVMRKMTTPDLQRLAELLEDMCKSGVQSPEEPVFTDLVKDTSQSEKPVDIPISKVHSSDDQIWEPESVGREDDKENVCRSVEPTPRVTPPTPMPEDEGFGMTSFTGVPLGSTKNRADTVKRRLMNSPFSLSPGNTMISPAHNRLSSPRDKPSPGSGRKGSRSGSPSRPLCQGVTKTGQPCRNMQAEGLLYCHRHNKDTTM